MVNSKTNFLEVINHISKIQSAVSIPIITAKLNYQPQVSVVIPTHKRPDLLKAALDSVLKQEGYPDFEVIVVDDDPKRGCKTEDLLMTINDKRVSFYKNSQNLGMINNWNRCFELATGNWVVMLHDDDLLLNFFLKECMVVLNNQPNIGILKPKWFHWNDDGGELIVPETETSGQLNRIYEISEIMGDRIGAPTGIVINKEKFTGLGGFNPSFFPSSDKCLVTLFAYYFEVYELDKVLSVYRWLRNDSLKVAILTGFLNNDYFLFKFLCRKLMVPSMLADNFLNFKFRHIVGYYQGINSDFDFDKSSIGLKDVNKIIGKLAYVFTEKIVLIYCGFYKFFGKPIFEKRQRQLAKFSVSAIE